MGASPTQPSSLLPAGWVPCAAFVLGRAKIHDGTQGKSHTIRTLLDNGALSVLPSDFIWCVFASQCRVMPIRKGRVDPDRLARKFPERPQYLEHDQESTSRLLHPEASYLQEILANYAKDHGRSLVIDGSLSDSSVRLPCLFDGSLRSQGSGSRT
jgi:hypothetical protein